MAVAELAVIEAGAPISLYLDLEEGRIADLEVVSRAALAWVAAIKEAAYALDPSLEVRIEFASGTPGSLSLNSIIKKIREAEESPVTWGALSLLALLWFGDHVLDKGFDAVWDEIVGRGEAQHVTLSPAQMDEIAKKVAGAIENRVAHPQVQQVYRELERDPAVRGVGATSRAGTRPSVIVPRSEFHTRSGRSTATDATTVNQRTITTKLTVTLIRPVLIQGERRWGLRGPTGEFGATIKDKEFIERTLSGTTAVPMVAGIEMDIDLETKEEFRGGAWTVIDRSVTHVLALRRPPVTGDLFPPP
jgi:hypothetical protein